MNYLVKSSMIVTILIIAGICHSQEIKFPINFTAGDQGVLIVNGKLYNQIHVELEMDGDIEHVKINGKRISIEETNNKPKVISQDMIEKLNKTYAGVPFYEEMKSKPEQFVEKYKLASDCMLEKVYELSELDPDRFNIEIRKYMNTYPFNKIYDCNKPITKTNDYVILSKQGTLGDIYIYFKKRSTSIKSENPNIEIRMITKLIRTAGHAGNRPYICAISTVNPGFIFISSPERVLQCTQDILNAVENNTFIINHKILRKPMVDEINKHIRDGLPSSLLEILKHISLTLSRHSEGESNIQ